MDRIRQLGDAIKNRYSKSCCIKLSIGISVGLVIVVVVVAVAVTVGGGGGGGEGGGDGEVTSRKETVTGDAPPVTEPPITRPQTMEWPNQFTVQLTSQRSSQILAVDDVTRRYVIEINHNRHYNLYIIVDFQKRQHTYVIMEKSEGDVTRGVEEKTVLYCDSSPFAHGYDGTFTSSATLREGGKSYKQRVVGRIVTVNADYMNKPYKLSSILVTLLQGSCHDLPADTLFQWDSKLTECGGNTTAAEDVVPVCPSGPCPQFEKTAQSTEQACDNFRKCNYVMSVCDSSWTQPYDQRPYCVCRRTIVDDVNNFKCPDDGEGGEKCTIPKGNIEDFEKTAACYCRYRISRIYPKMTSGSVSWEIKATMHTAPIKNYDQCPC